MKIYSTVKFFIVLNIICLLQKSIYAHHKIYSPRVKEGRQSFEWRGHFDVDDSDSDDNDIVIKILMRCDIDDNDADDNDIHGTDIDDNDI